MELLPPGDAVLHWPIELWEMAPTPAKARRIRVSTVQKLLKRHRVRRIDAHGALKILRSAEIDLQPGTILGRVAHIKVILERMRLADRQLKETEAAIRNMVDSVASRHAEEGVPGDIEILRSIPGVGIVMLSTLLAEAW